MRPKLGLNSYIVSSDTRPTQLAVTGVHGATGAALAEGDGDAEGVGAAEADADGDGDVDGDGLEPADARGEGVGESSDEHAARPSASTPTPTTVSANRETTGPGLGDTATTFLLRLFMSSSPTSRPGLSRGARSRRDRIIDRDPR
jgi:hypothetical protein